MNYEFYNDLDAINNIMPYNNKLDLFNPYEGFLAGNAFKNEYVPYKDYKVYKVGINSEKDEMIFNISQYGFMMHDMNLYLDVFPNDKDALNKFNEYRLKSNELITKYERKYGPLFVKSSDGRESFDWISKWPWVN